MKKSDFKIAITRLSKVPGERQVVDIKAAIPELSVSSAWVEDGTLVKLKGTLESVYSGVMFVGIATVDVVTECRRCLRLTAIELEVRISELFEQDYLEEEGDTYPIEGEFVNLLDMLRDAIVLELPRAPLCLNECAGLCQRCGANLNEIDCGHDDDDIDPRFKILDQLR